MERILLVEDDPDIRSVASLALRKVGGFTVEICDSGRAALEVAPRFSPDLIVLDVMMPEMDGPATLRALKALPELATVPVVFLTAKIAPEEVARYKELGAVGILAKPFDPMTLASQVRELAKNGALGAGP